MHAFAVLTAVMTFILLIAGGLVTSTDSGLSVPDWPLSYGRLMPPMVGGVRFEHSHRMLAGIVGLLIAVLAAWLWRRESRAWVKRAGALALGAVIAQAVLGGLTVLFILPPPLSIAHACLGQLVFCLVVAVAVAQSPAWARSAGAAGAPVRRASAVVFAACLLQLVLGALIRHSGRGVWVHAGWALVVAVAAGRLLRAARRDPGASANVARLASALCAGIGLQMLLGVLAAASRARPLSTLAVLAATAHVALGAALLACACVAAMWSWRSSQPDWRRWKVYLELTKPRLTGLAMVTVSVGYVMGSARPLDWLQLGLVVLGAGLVGGGANAVNEWMEREPDALMARTRARPLPTQRVTPEAALRFAAGASLCGLALLGASSNALAVALAAATLASYVAVYTPLKRMTSLCTPMGAVPGALPPLIGWAAARGSLSLEAGVLFAILFCWQLPHFLAIAWAHREDYARAGFRMLPVMDAGGDSTSRQMILYGLALLPISLLPTLLGLTGAWYFAGATGLGVWFVWMAVGAARARTGQAAHRLFLASVSYLPAVLALMVLDKRGL